LNGHTDPVTLQVASAQETALDKLSYQEILRAVQQLSPAYRTVFNLFVMDGLSHDEISNKLVLPKAHQNQTLQKQEICKKYY
jgi:RNA polymerase sigma-70 factor (ECF subfamily)